MIRWYFLDTTAAAIRAMEQYDSMQWILKNAQGEITKAEGDMVSISSPGFEENRSSGDVRSGENRMVNQMENLDVLRHRYETALEYDRWFTPAWMELTEEERQLLKGLYMDGLTCPDMCEELKIEKTTLYKRRNRALSHLSTLLYGLM